MYTESELRDKLSELRALTSENEVVEFNDAKTTFGFDRLDRITETRNIP